MPLRIDGTRDTAKRPAAAGPSSGGCLRKQINRYRRNDRVRRYSISRQIDWILYGRLCDRHVDMALPGTMQVAFDLHDQGHGFAF